MRWDDILNALIAGGLLKQNPANIMDQQFSEGFFTHRFENRISMNFYFEIHSEWARGNKEMLMISVILNQQIPIEVEEKISILCKEFSEQLQSNKEIYTAFYINDINNFDEEDQKSIKKNKALIQTWVNNLYWEIIEHTREKTEEDKIAILLKNKHNHKEFVVSANTKNTILIIDNEPDLNLTEKFLKLGDFETITCSNVNEALNLIEERYNDIAAILLNPMMPGLNIDEFVQFIKSDERYKHISVISTRKGDDEGGELIYYITQTYCKYCGAELPEGQTVCHVCGKKVI
ncbi:MAG: hypothetical protein ACFFDY_14680 [Candidatus Thorarchaeota archaeon]